LIGVLICLMAPSALALEGGAGRADSLKEALAALQASDSVWRSNDGEYRALLKAGGTAEEELRQFAEFVAEQRRFMLEDCRTVRELGGDPESLGYDCAVPETGDVASLAMPAAAEAAQTEQEKDAALEQQLDRLEGELDDLFRAEQEAMRRDASSQGQAASGGGASGSGSADGSASGDGTGTSAGRKAGGDAARGGAARTGQADRNAANRRQRDGGRQGREQGAGPGTDKSWLPPKEEEERTAGGAGGDDDDVVARQLREAAEKETDPVMKEKLWDEYRRYKEATS
jgi:hypothetical protein